MAAKKNLCSFLVTFLFFHKTYAVEIISEDRRISTAFEIAFGVTYDFYEMFHQCVDTVMPNEQFLIDNLHGYVAYPMKTTVGSSPKFTSNRKFFANLINTPGFKEILAKDIQAMRMAYYKKMQYCDNAVLDQQILREFYDREIDQSKI